MRHLRHICPHGNNYQPGICCPDISGKNISCYVLDNRRIVYYIESMSRRAGVVRHEATWAGEHRQ